MSITALRAENTTARATLSPPLKWAGGKRWLIPTLQELAESHRGRRLVEPFVGGLAVALGLGFENALLNDANPHLVNFYRWLQKGLQITSEMKNDREYFNSARDRFNRLVSEDRASSAEAAGLFYYLNRTGFNGLCRFNSSGFFNVPFGSYKSINYTADFMHYRATLRRWRFQSGDFEALRLVPEDLIYADPPYDVQFTRYAREGFGWADQERLAAWLASHPGPVIASNQATARIVDLYEGLGFEVQTILAPRMISCTGDRTPASEILATRNIR